MTALRTASEEGGRRSVIGFFVVREGLYREAPTSEVTSDSLTVPRLYKRAVAWL